MRAFSKLLGTRSRAAVHVNTKSSDRVVCLACVSTALCSHAGLLAHDAQSWSCRQESEEGGWWKQWGPDTLAFGLPPKKSEQGLREAVNCTGLWLWSDSVPVSFSGRPWEDTQAPLLRLHGEGKDLPFPDVLMIMPVSPPSVWDVSWFQKLRL